MAGGVLALIAIIVFAVVVLVASSVNIINQHEKGLVETLGKYSKTEEPGVAIIVPFFQRLKRVDMREQVIDVGARCARGR